MRAGFFIVNLEFLAKFSYMKYLSDNILNKLQSVVNKGYVQVLTAEIDGFIDFFNSLTDLREEFPDYDESMMIINLEKARKICG